MDHAHPKRLGFLSFGAWHPGVGKTNSAAEALRQTIELAVRKVVGAVAEGDMLRTQMAIVRRLSKYEPVNTVALGRQIAEHVIRAGRYAV